MTSTSDIGWGKYRNYEGPFYLGTQRFNMPAGPSVGEDFKRLAVITATEGGRFDAVNMYDRCILSVGLIQWCEAGMFGVSNMLGVVAGRYPKSIEPIKDLCVEFGYDFKQHVGGKWRFCTAKGEIIDTNEEQRQLFLLHSDGTKGSWDDASKEHAKKWAAAYGTVFEDPVAQKLQVQYTIARLQGFVMPDVKPIIFGVFPSGSEERWVNAAQAAFLSFSANLPAVAAKHLKIFAGPTTTVPGSPAWVKGMLRQLTFGPEISIYPARYNAIRPVLEKLYGIDLPDFAEELKDWREKEDIDPATTDVVNLTSAFGVQHALINLGYDIGPKGADGVIGAKTKAAIMELQAKYKLQIDGIVGPRTRAVILAVLHSR